MYRIQFQNTYIHKEEFAQMKFNKILHKITLLHIGLNDKSNFLKSINLYPSLPLRNLIIHKLNLWR